jgi:hypothetical protein
MASAVSVTSLLEEQLVLRESCPGGQFAIDELDEVRSTIGGKEQARGLGRVKTPVILSEMDEKNLRTGFGRFTLGVGDGVGETVGDGTATLVTRFGGATMKSTQLSIINPTARLLIRVFTILRSTLRSKLG